MNGEVISAFVLLIRLLLALTLLWAGLAKLRRHDAFALLVLEYQVLPNNLARPFGQVLPYAEMLIGLSLLLGFKSRFGALCACALLVLFSIAISMNLLRGRRLSCMCFGRNRDTIGWSQIYRNLSLLFVAVMIVATPQQPISLDGVLSSQPQPLPNIVPFAIALTVLLTGTVVWLLIGEGVRQWQRFEALERKHL